MDVLVRANGQAKGAEASLSSGLVMAPYPHRLRLRQGRDAGWEVSRTRSTLVFCRGVGVCRFGLASGGPGGRKVV